MSVGSICIFFSCFVNMRPWLPRASCFFPLPQRGATGPLQGTLVFSFPLYLLPSLAPVGVWTDPPSLDEWSLPCQSQTLGDTGYDQGPGIHDHHALEQEVWNLFWELKNMTKNIFSISETHRGLLGLLQQITQAGWLKTTATYLSQFWRSAL